MITIEPLAGLEIDKLKLLGKGTQGKVYRIDSQKCIKIFKHTAACREELAALLIAQNDNHFPRLYSAGETYIIRECINGIELNKFLSQYPLTSVLSEKLLELYESMREVGFKRLDTAIFHIFITAEGGLKLIDTAKALKKKTAYPKLILNGLQQLGYKKDFLDFVSQRNSDLFRSWRRSF